MERYDTLLISSPLAEHRAHLRGVLGEGYNLLEAENISQTMLLLRQNIGCIAALVLDVGQQKMLNNPAFFKQENVQCLRKIPVIAIAKGNDTALLNKAFGLGAADVIPFDYDPDAMLHRIENIVDLHLHKQKLETMVHAQAAELRQANNAMVDALSSIIEYRSVESGQHILRIRHFTQILLEEVVRCCPEYNLTEGIISVISSASALHDVGKIAIPDSVLLKPGPLSAEERELMKTHTVTGCRILDSLTHVADDAYLRYAHNICRYHHERWDGGGYPEGLSGDDIPICAQVVGLADVYDALTNKRVYKDAISCAQAVNMILKGECGVFSPKLLDCFKHVTHQFAELARDYADGLSPRTEFFDATLPAPKNEYAENSLDRLRGKYYAMVHYVNGFLLELNMDEGLFHVVYNPYPELAQFQGISSFEDMERLILEELVHPTERQRMQRLIHEGIGEFLDRGLRRQNTCFRFRSRYSEEGSLFDVSFLRINPADAKRRTLAVLVRRIDAAAAAPEVQPAQFQSDAVYACCNDRDFTLLETHSGLQRITGYTFDEIKTRFGGALIGLVHPDDRETVRRQYHEQLKNSAEVKLEFRLLHKDGSVRWVLDKGRLVSDGRGEYLLCAITDITRFKQENEQVINQLERYEIILAQTENVLFEWDVVTDKIEFSNTWEKIFGFAPIRNGLRTALTEGTRLHPDDLPLLLDAIGNVENGSAYEKLELRIATVKGRYIWFRIRATVLRDRQGNPVKVSGIIINIDSEKQAVQALQDRAERDSLTKLLNKDTGRRQAEEYFARFPDGVDGAVMIIDLDDFKQVNDRYGHLFGDSVLTQAAREIKKMFRNQDIVSRVGGDEFLVVMRGVSDKNLIEVRCQRLLAIFRSIFQNQRYNLPMSCSIGIALSPADGKTYYDLFNRADKALYWAKAQGKNSYVFYSEEQETLHLRSGMSSAVSNHIDSDEEPGLADDNLVRYAFQRLYGSKNVQRSVNDILELVGRKMNVSRVYVFENSDDNRFCSNTFEWCNEGIEPEIQNLQGISYEKDIAGYVDMYNEQGIFYCPDINELPENIYNIVAPQGIKSLLHCAIRDGGVFRGYIGFDECVQLRYWTKEQIQTLSYFSEMLSLFLMKQRRQEKAQAYAQELQTILDNQNAWIYIIDPDTCRLKYLNAKTRELAPEVTPGMRCYQALMGQSQRCKGCPGLGIREKKNDATVMYNDNFDLNVQAEATLINWGGEDSCLLTCREISKDR